MIALLTCSGSWLTNNAQSSSTGKVDSVLVSYDELRIANSKMIELKFEKEINDSLRSIIGSYEEEVHNYTKVVSNYNDKINYQSKQIEDLNKKFSKSQNKVKFYKGATIVSLMLMIVGFIL